MSATRGTLLRIASGSLLGIAVFYSVTLVFFAFQTFLPNMCAHSMCRQIKVPKDGFALHMFFGIHAWLLSCLWFARLGLEKYFQAHYPNIYSRRNHSIALFGGVTSGLVMLASLLIPLLFGLLLLLAAVLGAILSLLLLLR